MKIAEDAVGLFAYALTTLCQQIVALSICLMVAVAVILTTKRLGDWALFVIKTAATVLRID